MERETKPRAWWKTISLRGLLVLVLAIALWLGAGRRYERTRPEDMVA